MKQNEVKISEKRLKKCNANYYLHFFCNKKQAQLDLKFLELKGLEDLLSVITVVS